jgi:hypothetical protein
VIATEHDGHDAPARHGKDALMDGVSGPLPHAVGAERIAKVDGGQVVEDLDAEIEVVGARDI